MSTITPFARPLYVMLKPTGARCNLTCDYCYYLEKSRLYDNEKGPQLLSDELLEKFIRQYLEAQTMPQVLFTWHGGEPLLRPISFYRRALELQRKYAHGRQIDNCLQTNGTLLNDEWCRFFRDNNFLVGISIDGPKELHDAYRHSSFNDVMRGISLLQKHGVEWNAMAVIHRLNAERPVEFYQFFRQIGCRYLQFTPVVERRTNRTDGLTLASGAQSEGILTDFSVTPLQWGRFLCTLYDEWVRRDVGKVFVQLFDATLANWVGEAPGICSLSPSCGHAAVMEHNGDVYSCDHFVFPEYRLGNIREQTLTQMLYGERQQAFAQQKVQGLTRQCRECPYVFACFGECPRNRFVSGSDGEPRHNYLCAGYRQFFAHVSADMDYMRTELMAGRSPANIMQIKSLS